MLLRLRLAAAAARADRAGWAGLAYERGEGDQGGPFDRHELDRAQVLWGLQVDRGPADLPLLRFLLEQEAVANRESPLGGMSDELRMAALFVAEHGAAPDVWLQWQAKQANYDTWFGLDDALLLAAGVPATVDEVRSSDRPERDELLGWLLDGAGAARRSELDVAERLARARVLFPADPARVDPLTWSYRAQRLGDLASARGWLNAWAQPRPRDEATLRRLASELAQLGDHTAAAQAQQQLTDLVAPADLAFSLRQLARLHRLAGAMGPAWDALQACERALPDRPGWREVGLGRQFVEELFRVAAATPDDEAAGAVFAAAHRHAAAVPRLPLVALQAAADAAERVGERAAADHYRARCAAERRRIDQAR